ncbi:hypothetical protein SMY47_003917 [Cronobacter sakazakii]|nr:hypothetical protein [Cronobacter sakazakii]EKM7177733.1 hypothetical protein [Cronobacter sakazakii]EKM7178161.1 hypothetical protein [Cronobacter sakazakii]ELY4057640.1 hypothetical protein [Cronobacter sakazakii]ELY6153821.1 hypothetical protein [Cronobacter sakazakii]
MKNNALTLVLKNYWITSSADQTYNGKSMIGHFYLTDTFIVEYIKLIHGIEIPDSLISGCFTNISDTDTRKVMYMEGCDMLSKNRINEICKAVKSPPDNVKIYRNDVHIVKEEIMEKKNDLTF